jgi:hypothetical protein
MGHQEGGGESRFDSSAREKRRLRNDEVMKAKTKTKPDTREMRADYGENVFRGAVRGKYAARYREGTNIVLLDADVAEVFREACAKLPDDFMSERKQPPTQKRKWGRDV